MKYLIYSLIFFCLFTCNYKKSEINSNLTNINVNSKNIIKYDFNKLIYSDTLIKLEKNDSYILGKIQRFYIRDSIIGIVSDSKIFFYNEKGKSIKVVDKQGRGPDEYRTVDDIYLDGNYFYLLDRKKRGIHKYNYSGEFIDFFKTGLIGYSFSKTAQGNFVIYINSNVTEKTNHRLNFISIKNKQLDNAYFKISDKEYNWHYLTDLINFDKFGDNCYFSYSLNDTIYKIEHNLVYPFCYIDFGENRIPKSFLNRNYNDIRDFITKASQKNYIYSVTGFHISERFIYFAFKFKDSFIHAIYARQTQKLLLIDNFKNYLHIEGLTEAPTYYNFPLYSDEEFFYVLIEPYILKERLHLKHTESAKNKNDFTTAIIRSSASDNPILYKFKIKDF